MIKGGVWRNTEDEIMKAAVMKYGKNQARFVPINYTVYGKIKVPVDWPTVNLSIDHDLDFISGNMLSTSLKSEVCKIDRVFIWTKFISYFD